MRAGRLTCKEAINHMKKASKFVKGALKGNFVSGPLSPEKKPPQNNNNNNKTHIHKKSQQKNSNEKL